MSNEFVKAEGRRVTITNQQRIKIRKLYASILDDISDRMKFLKTRDNVSSILRLQYLEELKKEIKESMVNIYIQTEALIKNNMLDVSESVVKSNGKLLENMGFEKSLCSIAYYHVPEQMVNEIATGKLYKGRWTLSKAIWKDSDLKSKELESIIAKGVAANKSTYDIAKDLEKYVNPSARKPWDWSKVYPNICKQIDYNAQRLARTMVSHAYEESFVRTTKNNPFIEAYKWIISNSDRVCSLCQSRSTDDQYGLGGGIFPKNSLPLDHPNGMCTFATVITKSYEQIADDLADWVNGTGDGKLNKKLDIFRNDLEGSK